MEEFGLFKSYFDSLYNRYILSLLMCRIYAIKNVDGFLVMLPSKVSWNGRAIPLDEEDFSFLENQDEDIKYRLSKMFEVSYDEYIKKYGRFISKNSLGDSYWQLSTEEWVHGWIYANPAYVELKKDGDRIEFIRKFDYISFETPYGRFDTEKNMYVYVDASLGLIIGGSVDLIYRGTHHSEGEDYIWEEWNVNFFTSDLILGRYLSFEKFCKENYQKDNQTGQFYLIPYKDIEKWNEEQKVRLCLHCMSCRYHYDEDGYSDGPGLYYLRGKEYKRMIDYNPC